MSDTPNPGASVLTVENPHTDPVTVAHSRHDAMIAIAAGIDDEVARMQDKLERAKADVEAAKQYVADAKAHKATRAADVADAKADLDATIAAHPELADEVNARRDAAKATRLAELHAELARLEGN